MRKSQNKHLAWADIVLIFLFLATIFLSGCGGHTAVGRTENYIYAWPNISYTSDKNIAIGVIDKRPYVVDGNNNQTYVGLMRGGFYNPWYMNTESGKPLSDDLTQAIVSGFKNAGVSVKEVTLRPNMDQGEIDRVFLSGKSDKKLLVRIKEWQSDTFHTIAFVYDVTAEVYDEKGTVVAECTEKNTHKEWDDQSTASPIDTARTVLSTILNNEAIVAALK